MDYYFRDPLGASVIAAAIVIAFVFARSKINNEGNLKNSQYFKPAFLVGILVFFIVHQGQGDSGPVLKQPY